LKKVCQHKIHREPHHLSADGNLSWEEVECLGSCVNAPMVQVWKDTYEDLTPERLEQIIDDLAAGKPVKPGPQVNRQFSAPEGGPTTLTDAAIYRGERTFTRQEPQAQAGPAASEVKPAEVKPEAAPPPAPKPLAKKNAVKKPAAKKPAAPKSPPAKKPKT
jgi:NADH-quinone oxidoreductase subunit E